MVLRHYPTANCIDVFIVDMNPKQVIHIADKYFTIYDFMILIYMLYGRFFILIILIANFPDNFF
ncbi:hypothetical protein D3C84_1207700 [compost metagenome]